MSATLKLTSVLLFISGCGQVTAFETPDSSGDQINTSGPDASLTDTSVDSPSDRLSALPDLGPATNDSNPQPSTCEIAIGPNPWPDPCQISHNGWCNSSEINTTLLNGPHPETKNYTGTCEPGCFDNGNYLYVRQVCHDGTVCQLITVALGQKQPLCTH